MYDMRQNSSGLAQRETGKSFVRKLIGPFLVLVFLGSAQIWAQPGNAQIWAQPGSAQISGQQDQDSVMIQTNPRAQQHSFDDFGARDPLLAKRQAVLLNAQRQKNMISDADKLLKLATELKAEIDAGNPDSLSTEQLNKIARIEKLAHSVKEKMSITIGSGPTITDAFP